MKPAQSSEHAGAGVTVIRIPDLHDHYQRVRRQSVALTEGLDAEDMLAQSMPDASPVKWHLAHTTWFFETFLLLGSDAGYKPFDDRFAYLFNSYYDHVGVRGERHQRGLLTRPSLAQVLDYRRHVDTAMQSVFHRHDQRTEFLIALGLHHEMQHQELMLTDVLHLFSHNPLCPALLDETALSNDRKIARTVVTGASGTRSFEGGLVSVGADAHTEAANAWNDFSYDCEQPRHQQFLAPFRLCTNLVTNADWVAFMDDGGYRNPLLWLSDGWQHCQQAGWQTPLYWQQRDGKWHQFGMQGMRELVPEEPVCHISYYEADAFARWAGKRLPREQEWEHAAAGLKMSGNFLEQRCWHPRPAHAPESEFTGLYGDVWEWTQSAFAPYPGFRAGAGALGEYNGKFMANQLVLRGGSCVTPQSQIRLTYRNFFYPHQRWQFMGLRLAEDD